MKPHGGAEFVVVDYGMPTSLAEISRALYEERRYQPPFENLPTKEQFDARHIKGGLKL